MTSKNSGTTYLDQQSDAMIRDGWTLEGEGKTFWWENGPLRMPLDRAGAAAAKRVTKRATNEA